MLPELVTAIPGPRSRELAARLHAAESQNVTYLADDFPVFWDRAGGTNVWDVDGNRFLDLTSAFAVCGLGHCDPQVVSAARDQAGRLLHAMGDVHPTALKVEVCEALSRLTFERWGLGRGKSILGSAGFEAVEAALKTAFLATGKPAVVTFEGAYHGLGYGALMVGGPPRFRTPFAAQLGGRATVVPFPACACDAAWNTGSDTRVACRCGGTALAESLARVEAELARGETGAVLIEPVLGRGGQVVPAGALLPALRTLCDRHGAVLVFDEIYTGFNRTGRLFACEHFDTYPDLVCTGKALASGFPLSACTGRADLMDQAWPPSSGEALHTSTFLGNPLGCRMALASLSQHENPALAEGVQRNGLHFKHLLESVAPPRRSRVRGLGLMLGLAIYDDHGRPDGRLAASAISRALADGLILLNDGPEGHVLALSPPFAIGGDEMGFVRDRLAHYLARESPPSPSA
jgi:4-aminobutyrate aminotransferase-like enzyme